MRAAFFNKTLRNTQTIRFLPTCARIILREKVTKTSRCVATHEIIIIMKLELEMGTVLLVMIGRLLMLKPSLLED